MAGFELVDDWLAEMMPREGDLLFSDSNLFESDRESKLSEIILNKLSDFLSNDLNASSIIFFFIDKGSNSL